MKTGKYGPIAKKGHIFVCMACGKSSLEMYGGPTASPGWDESCMLNCLQFRKDLLIRGNNGRVVEIKKDNPEK